MISKQKLINGYVETDNEELLKLFLIECLKHDDINMPMLGKDVHKQWAYFAISENMVPCGHGAGIIRSRKVELSLNDFKPKSIPTLELVEDLSTTDIARAMLDGEIFYNKDGLMSYSWDGEDFVDSLGRNISIWASANFYRLTSNI